MRNKEAPSRREVGGRVVAESAVAGRPSRNHRQRQWRRASTSAKSWPSFCPALTSAGAERIDFEGVTMLPNDPSELTQAISQLRKVLASEGRLGLTTEYLVHLQSALEVAERAVRTERLTRKAYEFQGE
jgi:hypothetical protein